MSHCYWWGLFLVCVTRSWGKADPTPRPYSDWELSDGYSQVPNWGMGQKDSISTPFSMLGADTNIPWELRVLFLVGCDLPWGQCSWCHAFATCLETDGRGHINTGLPSSVTHGLGAGACAFIRTVLLLCTPQHLEQCSRSFSLDTQGLKFKLGIQEGSGGSREG